MSITYVQEMDLEGARDFYTSLEEGDVGFRTFRVLTDSAAHTEADIVGASFGGVSIPAPLELFPGSTTALCIKIRPQRDRKDTTKWLVRCDYKSILNQQELNRAADPDPLNRATICSGQSRTVMMPMRRLLRTLPYQNWSEAGPGAAWTLGMACNSATDPLDPPIDVAVTEWEGHFEKNVSALPSWVFDPTTPYANGVNDADQTVNINGLGTRTIKKGTGKLSNLTFSPLKKENGTAFITIGWNVTIKGYRPLFGSESDRFGPWDQERLDEGMRTYNTSLGRWTNVPASGGGVLQLPVPFDGDGNAINTTGARIPQSGLWWIAYRPFGDRVDFSVIPWS